MEARSIERSKVIVEKSSPTQKSLEMYKLKFARRFLSNKGAGKLLKEGQEVMAKSYLAIANQTMTEFNVRKELESPSSYRYKLPSVNLTINNTPKLGPMSSPRTVDTVKSSFAKPDQFRNDSLDSDVQIGYESTKQLSVRLASLENRKESPKVKKDVKHRLKNILDQKEKPGDLFRLSGNRKEAFSIVLNSSGNTSADMRLESSARNDTKRQVPSKGLIFQNTSRCK